MQSSKDYLESAGVEAAVARAVTQVLKDRPADPVAAIGKILIDAASKTIGVGSAFPMNVVVHAGFAGNTPSAPQPMSSASAGLDLMTCGLAMCLARLSTVLLTQTLPD